MEYETIGTHRKTEAAIVNLIVNMVYKKCEWELESLRGYLAENSLTLSDLKGIICLLSQEIMLQNTRDNVCTVLHISEKTYYRYIQEINRLQSMDKTIKDLIDTLRVDIVFRSMEHEKCKKFVKTKVKSVLIFNK